jgi:hypothetical protein
MRAQFTMPFVRGIDGLLVEGGIPRSAITTTIALHPDVGVPPAYHALLLPYPADEALRLADNAHDQARWIHRPQFVAIVSPEALKLLHPSAVWDAMPPTSVSSAENSAFITQSRNAKTVLPRTINPMMLDDTRSAFSSDATNDHESHVHHDGSPPMTRAELVALLKPEKTRPTETRKVSNIKPLETAKRSLVAAEDDSDTLINFGRSPKRPRKETEDDDEDFTPGTQKSSKPARKSEGRPKGKNSSLTSTEQQLMPPPATKKARKPYPKNRKSRGSLKAGPQGENRVAEGETGLARPVITQSAIPQRQTLVKRNDVTKLAAGEDEERIVYDSD